VNGSGVALLASRAGVLGALCALLEVGMRSANGGVITLERSSLCCCRLASRLCSSFAEELAELTVEVRRLGVGATGRKSAPEEHTNVSPANISSSSSIAKP
jgi:hypothetical protein